MRSGFVAEDDRVYDIVRDDQLEPSGRISVTGMCKFCIYHYGHDEKSRYNDTLLYGMG
jgi:hypothetical protein